MLGDAIEARFRKLVESNLFACGISSGRNNLPVYKCKTAHGTQEVDGRLETSEIQEITSRISTSITETHDLRLDDIVLVEPWTLPRTTSGKMQRYLCRSAYLSATLQTL